MRAEVPISISLPAMLDDASRFQAPKQGKYTKLYAKTGILYVSFTSLFSPAPDLFMGPWQRIISEETQAV